MVVFDRNGDDDREKKYVLVTFLRGYQILVLFIVFEVLDWILKSSVSSYLATTLQTNIPNFLPLFWLGITKQKAAFPHPIKSFKTKGEQLVTNS